VGALIGRRAKRNREEEAQPAEDPYLRALTACLEGRGYVVIYTPAD
jgi:hypothetical protein